MNNFFNFLLNLNRVQNKLDIQMYNNIHLIERKLLILNYNIEGFYKSIEHLQYHIDKVNKIKKFNDKMSEKIDQL